MRCPFCNKKMSGSKERDYWWIDDVFKCNDEYCDIETIYVSQKRGEHRMRRKVFEEILYEF